MKKINFYTKEETNKIIDLFMSKAPRQQCEEYAKEIGRTFLEIKQKAYYEFNYNKKKKKDNKNKAWTEGQLNFLHNNWRNLNTKEREKWAKSIGRTYQACEKMFYKTKPRKNKIQQPGEITVTHLTKANSTQKAAVITIGDVVLELPITTKSIDVNGNVLIW